MQNKRNILLIVFVLLISSSAFLLYKSYSSEPLAIISSTVSDHDILVKDEVQAVKIKINSAIKNFDPGGSLEGLLENQQFQELLTDSVRPIVIGSFGRGNPFLPPQYGQ